jgi:ribonuclease HI
MDNERIRALLRTAVIGTMLDVTWCFYDQATEETRWKTSRGTIATKQRDGTVRVHYPNCAHMNPAIRYPLPPEDENISIAKIEILANTRHGMPPITFATASIEDEPEYVIFADGGTVTATGSSAAAIVIREPSCGQVWKRRGVEGRNYPGDKQTIHSRYYPASTNNVSQYLSFLAALRVCIRSRRKTVIITDALIITNHLTGTQQCRNPHLKPLVAEMRELYGACAGHVIVAHMRREDHNPAEEFVKLARNAALGQGDQNLFIEAPAIRRRQVERNIPVHADTIEISSIAAVIDEITTVEQFALFRKFKSRSSCPIPAIPSWATLVLQQCRAINRATTPALKDKALIALQLLPTLFLPSGANHHRIQHHLNSGAPFNVNNRRAFSEATTDDRERLSKTVTRLAYDFKIRQAVNIMQTVSETNEEIPFAEKMAMLREKFIRRETILHDTPLATTVPFNSIAVRKAIKSMPNNAANCIDGWSPTLLRQAISTLPEIADEIGYIAAQINDSQFGTIAMDIIRAGRLVAVPKPTGGIRPITISSFFAKLTGALIWTKSRPRCSQYQFAIGKKRGCERIIHTTRKALAEGRAIIRIDVVNAFNHANRARIQQLVKGMDPEIMSYFQTMYGPKSKLFVYGASEIEMIEFEEGVRQGDAFSGFFFCLLMDQVCAEFKERIDDDTIIPASFMDDLTITCDPSDAATTIEAISEALHNWGFVVNYDKSAILFPEDYIIPSTSDLRLKIANPLQQFKMLGANITSHYDEFNQYHSNRIEKFFDTLQTANLHPQLTWTILRLCGAPKMIYYAATTPPQHGLDILTKFDGKLRQATEHLIGPVDAQLLYAPNGGGFPCYAKHATLLFEQSKRMALHGVEPSKVVLTTTPESNPELMAHLDGQHHAPYLFFTRPTELSYMSPSEFITALSIRLRTLPRHTCTLPKQCICGRLCRSYGEVIDHVFACDRMSAFTFTQRHDLVKSAIAALIRSYGFNVTIEPRFYSYDTGLRQRPDITVNTARPITTDLVICVQDGNVGAAASRAAQNKRRIHSDAVQRQDHLFVPFAMEVHGHCDESCYSFIKHIRNHLPPYTGYIFEREMFSVIAITLAKARVRSIHGLADTGFTERFFL